MDRYAQFAASPAGRTVVRRLGLPRPAPLRRYTAGQPLLEGPAAVGGCGRLGGVVEEVLAAGGVPVVPLGGDTSDHELAALVFDASSLSCTADLRALFSFVHTGIGRLAAGGRLVVLATPPEAAGSSQAAVASRAVEGFVRSVARELRGGATAQLVYAAPGVVGGVESTLRFLLSARSAYVSGQVIRVGVADVPEVADRSRPLDGAVAVVTGAARGIGAAIASVLARDGASVVCADVPAQGEALAAVANAVGGSALALDVRSERAAGALPAADIVVHNAGITRDRTVARMSPDEWDAVLDVNLLAVERLNSALLDGGLLRPGGRIVCVSSVSGIAGNRGQANYAASKAGVIGIIEAYASVLAERGGTINAVAPGFIETRMTSAMPVVVREAGRRMNSLAQGGLPVDVAETVAWLASPGSAGVNGQVVRVCGQSLLGA